MSSRGARIRRDRVRTCSDRIVRLALALILVGPAVAVAQDWLGFRGPGGDGRAVDGFPEAGTPVELTVRWKVPLGSGYSGISVSQGKAVTAFAAANEDVVVAFETQSGRELWRVPIAERYRGIDGAHDGPIATPTIHENQVFMVDPAGRMVALGLDDGELLWEVHLRDQLQGSSWFYGFCGSVTVLGDHVFVATGGEGGAFAAFDRTSGDLAWRSFEDQPGCGTPILRTTADGQTELVVLGFREAAILDARSGEVRWSGEHGGGGPFGVFTSTPLALGSDRYLLKHDDTESRFLDLSAEQPVLGDAMRIFNRSYSPPTRIGDIVVGYTSRFLSAVDASTGDQLWRSRQPGDGFPIVLGERLVILTKEGSLHLGTAGGDGWTEEHSVEVFEDLSWTPPTFAEGSLFVRSLGELARVDLVTRDVQTTSRENQELPPELRELTRRLDGAADASQVVDSFLDGRRLPIVDRDRVLFLWRGEAADVGIAGDLLGARNDAPMNRLEGTDLWFRQSDIPSGGRIKYTFFVDYEPVPDPRNPRRFDSTSLAADMNTSPTPDLEFSWFATPGVSEQIDHLNPPTQRRGRLERHEVTMTPPPQGDQESEPVTVPVKVWLPPGYDETDRRYPVAFVHNPWALDAGHWANTLENLVGRTVEPLVVVFVEARGPGLWRVYDKHFMEDVLPLVESNYRLSTDRSDRAGIGMGWDCLPALTLSMANPDRFGKIGLQSYWAFDTERGMIETARDGKTAADAPFQIFLEWGELDLRSPRESWDMRAQSQWLLDELRGHGWSPTGGPVADATDWLSWRARTDLLLETLFPLHEGD